MSLLSVCEWLETTALAALVRESMWGFQIVVAVHILGLIVSVGTLLWMDLRLMGIVMTGAPVSYVTRRLMPWLLSGFVVMLLSGSALFVGFATDAYGNLYFWMKMAAIALAGVNALFYHFATERRIAAWDAAPRPPLAARMAGLTSIILWTAVIMAGRMMSYTMF